MLDFGGEFTLESFRTPWLILIQLLVLLLFLAFLFCITIINNASDHTTTPHSPSSTLHSTHVTLTTNPLQITPSSAGRKAVENRSIEREIPSRGIVREVEGIAEGEASSMYFLHPCYYFKLARVAFLKCFGLDSDNPATQKHRGKK